MFPNPIRIHRMMRHIRKEREIIANLRRMYPNMQSADYFLHSLITEFRTYLYLCYMPEFIRKSLIRKIEEVR